MKIILTLAAWVALLAGYASAQEGAPEASSGNAFYTVEQARRGSGFFRVHCYECHVSSEFARSTFEERWTNRAVGDFYEFVVYSMPLDYPGGLPEQTYADIIAYVLQLNDFPAGETELPPSMDALMEMIMWEEEALVHGS